MEQIGELERNPNDLSVTSNMFSSKYIYIQLVSESEKIDIKPLNDQVSP